MIKLIAFGVVLVVLILILGFWYDARRRSDREHRAGLKGRKAHVAALETTASKQEACLREIQEIATSSGIATGDPVWELVAQKIDEVLEERTAN